MLMKLLPALYYTGMELFILVVHGGRGMAVVPIHPHASTVSSLGSRTAHSEVQSRDCPVSLPATSEAVNSAGMPAADAGTTSGSSSPGCMDSYLMTFSPANSGIPFFETV